MTWYTSSLRFTNRVCRYVCFTDHPKDMAALDRCIRKFNLQFITINGQVLDRGTFTHDAIVSGQINSFGSFEDAMRHLRTSFDARLAEIMSFCKGKAEEFGPTTGFSIGLDDVAVAAGIKKSSGSRKRRAPSTPPVKAKQTEPKFDVDNVVVRKIVLAPKSWPAFEIHGGDSDRDAIIQQAPGQFAKVKTQTARTCAAALKVLTDSTFGVQFLGEGQRLLLHIPSCAIKYVGENRSVLNALRENNGIDAKTGRHVEAFASACELADELDKYRGRVLIEPVKPAKRKKKATP